MFDAIEDITTDRLVAELLSRTPSNLSVALVEIADEMKLGLDADFRWLCEQSSVLVLAAAVIQKEIAE